MPEVDPRSLLHLGWSTLQQWLIKIVAGNLKLYSSLRNEAPILENTFWWQLLKELYKFFTESIGIKNKVVISEAFISACSHFYRIWSKCEANWSKNDFNNYMLKEPIIVSFFVIHANFCFTVMNFTEAKFDKDPLN